MLPPGATARNTGRRRPVNSQPGRLRYVAQASPPASSGSVPLPVRWPYPNAPKISNSRVNTYPGTPVWNRSLSRDGSN
jgi:hypothetical protein